jgi:hypothetical protein
MPFPKPVLRLFKGYALAALELAQASAYCGYGLCPVQTVQQRLIAAGILNNEFCAAIDSQDEGSFPSLEAPHISLEITLKIRNRTDFPKINHLMLPSISSL